MKKYLCHNNQSKFGLVLLEIDRINSYSPDLPHSYFHYSITLSQTFSFGYSVTTTYLYINTKKALCGCQWVFFLFHRRRHIRLILTPSIQLGDMTLTRYDSLEIIAKLAFPRALYQQCWTPWITQSNLLINLLLMLS